LTSEANPRNFQPFGRSSDGAVIRDGAVPPTQAPGIGFETRSSAEFVPSALKSVLKK
jgi:hypothetical protein